MLKLYNIYKEVILEATEIDLVMDAIKNHYFVNIYYDNGKNDGTANQARYCQVYNFGKTSNGNNAIRVWQTSGPGKVGWKTLRLNRIDKWEPTEMKFYRPVDKTAGFSGPSYNPTGDKTLSWGGSVTTSKFDDKYIQQ